MFQRKHAGIIVAVVVVIGLLIAVGSAIQRSAWSQGYMMGRLSAGGEDVAIAPYMPYGYPGFGHAGFSPLGTFLKIGALILLGIVVLKFLRFHHWKKTRWHKGGPTEAGQSPHEHWAKHWRERGHEHWPMPPWCRDWEQPAAEESPEAESATEPATAEG